MAAIKVFGSHAPGAGVGEKRAEGLIVDLPKRHPDQIFDMHFVNGVQTWLRDHVIETTILGLRFDADIDPLHNRAGLLPGDMLQAWLEDIKISKDLARLAVKNEVLEHARDGKPYILVCHSQGAAICAQGITEALTEAAGNVVLQDRIKKLTGVLSVGGFTQQNRFPDGIVVELVCNDGDPICKLAIDFTQPVKTITNLLLAPIDILTRWFNEHSLNKAYLRGACNDMPDTEACRALAVIEAVLLANLRRLNCGNGKVDGNLGEVCDGTNLAGQKCQSQGFPAGGVLACASDCQSFDTSQCIQNECDDGVSCTQDAFVPGTGCTHTPDDSLCATDNDNNDANCSKSICSPQSPSSDASGCVEGATEPGGSLCDDGIACTTQDICANSPFLGICAGGMADDSFCPNQNNSDADCSRNICAGGAAHQP